MGVDGAGDVASELAAEYESAEAPGRDAAVEFAGGGARAMG